MARIGRSPTASTQPRTGQTPSQATLTKLKGATYQSGSLSVAKGSDFERRYQEQVAHIKLYLAKGVVTGLHDPNPMTIPQDFGLIPPNDPEILAELYKIPAVTIAIAGLASERPPNARWGDELRFQLKKERDAHKAVIASHLKQIMMEKNAPLIQALEEEQRQKQLALEQKIRETATSTPTTPAITSYFPIIPIIIIAVIVGIFLLRRKA